MVPFSSYSLPSVASHLENLAKVTLVACIIFASSIILKIAISNVTGYFFSPSEFDHRHISTQMSESIFLGVSLV